MEREKQVNQFVWPLDWSKSEAGEFLRERLTSVSPWSALVMLGEEIGRLGTEGERRGLLVRLASGVWAHPTARISPYAVLEPPCVVGAYSEVRPHAYLRGKVMLGAHCVAGHCSELKNCVLFDYAALPHFNYAGDSVLGYRAHLGAGAILSNVRADGAPVRWYLGDAVSTPLRKIGAVVGDLSEVGCNAVLNPGTVLGVGAVVRPARSVKGYIKDGARVIESNA